MLNALLSHPDPIIRYKARVNILQEDPASPENLALRQEIRTSPRIRKLFSDVTENGTIPFHPYTKWQGAHWVLTVLADTGYPPGDPVLLPLRDQVYSWILVPRIQRRYSPPHRQEPPDPPARLDGRQCPVLLAGAGPGR